MKKVIITGATSFLGSHILRTLDGNDEYRIFALVRKESVYKLNKQENVHICPGELSTIKDAFQNIKEADIFLHFAWDGSGDQGRMQQDTQKKNVEYSLQALKLACDMGCKMFLFPGSQAEYGIQHEEISEETKLAPISAYGKAKVDFASKAELYCKSRNINFVHLRIFSVYGNGDRYGTLVNTCIRAFMNNEHISLGECKQQWNYIYIADFVKIVLSIMNENISGTYNVGSDDTRCLRDFVYEIYNIMDKKGSVDFSNSISKPEGVPDLNPNIGKLKTIIPQFKFTSFSEGIVTTIKAMKEEINR